MSECVLLWEGVPVEALASAQEVLCEVEERGGGEVRRRMD